MFIVGIILETACRLKVSGAKIQKGNYTISDKYKAPNHVYCTISDKYKAPNHVVLRIYYHSEFKNNKTVFLY